MILNDTQLEKYAGILIWALKTARTKPYNPYDSILIRYDLPAIRLAEILSRELTKSKFNIIPRAMNTPVMEKEFYFYSDQKQRKFIGSWENSLFENLNGNIYLHAPASLTHLKDIDPKRINDVALARKPLRKIMEKREERGLFSWTLCTFPTEELAKQAKLSIKDYSDQIIKACFIDEKNPVGKWKEIYKNSGEIKKWLQSFKIKTIHLESKSCDLVISLGEKRRFLGVSGHNIPSFEIFTSPDWRGTCGKYHSNLPSYRSGNYVRGVNLEFKNGNIINSSAEEGEEFLRKMIVMDAGAKRIGEFSLTDRRFSRIDKFMADTLFDENFGGRNGNSHIAIGASYSDTYDGNPAKLTAESKKKLGLNDSALHWDLVNTEEKTVYAVLNNGKSIIIYEDGMFKY